MSLYDTGGGWGGQPKMTDDTDVSLRGRRCENLDKNEGKKYVFADKYLNKSFYMPQSKLNPKIAIKCSFLNYIFL